MKSCRELGINQPFTSDNFPTGNADTEMVFRAMKEELRRLREWTSSFELADILKVRIGYCSGSHLHSSFRYKAPILFEEEDRNNQLTLLAAL